MNIKPQTGKRNYAKGGEVDADYDDPLSAIRNPPIAQPDLFAIKNPPFAIRPAPPTIDIGQSAPEPEPEPEPESGGRRRRRRGRGGVGY